MQATFTKQDAQLALLPNEEPFQLRTSRIGDAKNAAPIRVRHSETVADFLSKKREIFLVQMNLDTKRAEICKLEQRALQRENALKRSESMLEEDAIKFDAFLKENDEKVQQALKTAEAEAKKKQDKIAEIKRLQAEMTAIRSEVNKYEEQLEDFQLYKKFLDNVTPQEWFEEQQKKRERIKEEKLDQWRMLCEAVKKRKTDAATARANAEQEYNNARTQQEAEKADRMLKDAIDHLKASKLLKEPPKPCLEADADGDIEEAAYFQHPYQLLDLFGGLEEQNLFLIQNLQETEEGLDRNRNKLAETKSQVESEIESLKKQVEDLEAVLKIRRRNHKYNRDGRSISVAKFAYGDNAHHSPVCLDDLCVQLTAVYGMCGFVGDANIGMLTMLTNVEMKLEELLNATSQIPKELVYASERGREKSRRQKYRAEKMEQQKKEHEARVKRALERAEAPVFKKTGKPEMFRSTIPKRKKPTNQVVKGNDDEELLKFLAMEL